MLSRPSELVELGLQEIPDILVGVQQRRDLQVLPDFLPAACTMGGFECRLDDNPQVDFGLCLQQSKSFAGMGLPWDCKQALPHSLAQFIDEWVSHDSLIRDNVDCIWLGFDRTGSSEADTPFMYFSPSLNSASLSGRDNHLIETVMNAGLSLLAPGAHDASLPVIRRCLEALPECGEVLLVASLQQRGSSGVRLELRMPTAEVLGFLQRCNWPGDYDWLQQTLTALDTHLWLMPIQVEVCDQVLPTLSLEFPVRSYEIESGEWEYVLDQFVRLGLCLPEKQSAVTQWVKNHTDAQDRQLDLKIRNNGSGKTVAKAYLVVEDTLSLF